MHGPGNPNKRRRRRLATAAIALTLAALFVAALYQPWLAQWGSTAAERSDAVVGDGIVDADLVWTRSITIDAPPEAVWPWLLQMGVDRAGFYNYDWGEQLVNDPVTTPPHPSRVAAARRWRRHPSLPRSGRDGHCGRRRHRPDLVTHDRGLSALPPDTSCGRP